MVRIGPAPGTEVRHQVEHAVALHHALAGRRGNVVPGFDRHRGIDFEMRIDHDLVAHLAGADVVQGMNAGRLDQCGPDGLDFLVVDRAVHKIVHRIPRKAPPHLGAHEADDERGDRVEDSGSPPGCRRCRCPPPAMPHPSVRATRWRRACWTRRAWPPTACRATALPLPSAPRRPPTTRRCGLLHGIRLFQLAEGRPQHADAHRPGSSAPSIRDAAVSKRWWP